MKSQAALTAAAIKKELKALGISCKAKSSNYSGGDSVDIKVEGLTPAQFSEIKSLLSKYQYGSFNGMDDSYSSDNLRNDIPQTKYLFIDNNHSPEMHQAAYEWSIKHYRVEGLPELYSELQSHHRVGDEWAHTQVYRVLANDGPFWQFKGDFEAYSAQRQSDCQHQKDVLAMIKAENGEHDSSILVYYNEDSKTWTVSKNYILHASICRIEDTAELVKLIINAITHATTILHTEKAAREQEKRDIESIKPFKEETVSRFVTVSFPACNKNHHLDDNDLEIRGNADTGLCEVKKVITFTGDNYAKVSKQLLTSFDFWEKIGGSYCDDQHLAGLAEHSKEYYAAWRKHGITCVIEVVNTDTNDKFYVNTEGYSYARYVGRDENYFSSMALWSVMSDIMNMTLH